MTNIKELLKRAEVHASRGGKWEVDFLVRDMEAALRETNTSAEFWAAEAVSLTKELDQLRAVREELQSDFESFVEHHRATEAENARLRTEIAKLERELVLQSEHSRDLARDKAELRAENARLKDERISSNRCIATQTTRLASALADKQEVEQCLNIALDAWAEAAPYNYVEKNGERLRARKEGKP